MIQIQVDGQTLNADVAGMKTMSDLIELVKASIDPDTMITSVLFNGEALSDNDWNSPLSHHRDRCLEVKTGTRNSFVAERLGASADILAQVIIEFEETGKSYRSGATASGNSKLGTAVEDLLAFMNWFQGILALDEHRFSGIQKDFTENVSSLKSICEQLWQQQLYQSWWVLSETITIKLVPKLEELKVICQNSARC